MSSATNLLNQAVERMTTGYKINHSKDNAANYSISEKMNMQISSFDVAADNVAMGMDLVTTASDIISNMQDKASRLQALCTQARNGTYGGGKSLLAINAEANSLIAEINRLYNTAEYNNVSLFNQKAYEIVDHLPKAGASGFIDETGLIATASVNSEYGNFIADPKTYTDAEVAAMTRVKDVSTFSSGQKYAIYSKEELQKLADYVNSGNNTGGVEFVLGADIDLSSISNWTPIGDYSTNTSYQFKGTFDGNGHVIKNLTIDNSTKDYQGLFGRTASGSVIKNIGLEGGSVKGKGSVGGLVGQSYSTISNSYATGAVTGSSSSVGGLVGSSFSSITNSYATGAVTGSSYYVGGLVGQSYSSISNSYATGNVTGKSEVGGLVGEFASSSISNSYATGAVTGSSDYVGGLVGYSEAGTISDSYATGAVTGLSDYVGGLAGRSYVGTISNSYATGAVTGSSDYVGGLVGQSYSGTITNSYATGNVIGEEFVGGLLGQAYCANNNVEITNSISYSTVSGNTAVGALVGGVVGFYQRNWNYGGGDEGTDEYSDGELLLTNCSAIANSDYIGGYYKYIFNEFDYEDPDTGDRIFDYSLTTEQDTTFDLSVYNANISAVEFKNIVTTLQVGINSDSSCQIDFVTNFQYDLSSLEGNIASDEAFGAITDFINLLSERSTQLGAVQNRLDSALESIEVNLENLVSSSSTIRDADIAEESSAYIRQQILQQASATLLSTANQSPSIALQLI